MRADEYMDFDGVGLAELVRRGETTATAIAEAAIARIDSVDKSINAVVQRYFPAAREAARDADPGARLCGVPFLAKDMNIEIAGTQLTYSCRWLEQVPPAAADSPLAARWRAAGLTILGRTNTPEFAGEFVTEPTWRGATRNPWDAALSPGGSSGGAAAAVAAGMVPIAHGTDSGGSIRVPAAACGLVGLKPSRGWVPVGPNLDEPAGGTRLRARADSHRAGHGGHAGGDRGCREPVALALAASGQRVHASAACRRTAAEDRRVAECAGRRRAERADRRGGGRDGGLSRRGGPLAHAHGFSGIRRRGSARRTRLVDRHRRGDRFLYPAAGTGGRRPMARSAHARGPRARQALECGRLPAREASPHPGHPRDGGGIRRRRCHHAAEHIRSSARTAKSTGALRRSISTAGMPSRTDLRRIPRSST